MIKRVLVLCLALAMAASGATVAGAATKHKRKTHTFTAAVQLTTLTSQGSPPVSGSSVDVGTMRGTLGAGALVQTTTFGVPSVGKFKSTGTLFGPRGTVKYIVSGSGTADAQGNITFTGSGKFTGGTDRYKGATGHFTFTGSQPHGSNVSTFQARGKLRY